MFKNKVSENDYTPSMLPGNRRELFIDVVKHHWVRLLIYGCLILILTFPVHALAIAEDFYGMELRSRMGQIAVPEEAVETVAGIAMEELRFALLVKGIEIPLLVALAVGLAGMARVIRQYAWGENVEFAHDFVLGIRQNAGQFALFGLIAGSVRFLCSACLRFNEICTVLQLQGIRSVAPSEAYEWLQIIPAVLSVLLLLPIGSYAMVACTCYENKLRHNLKIGRVCYFRSFWGTLLALGCGMMIFLPQNLSGFSSGGVVLCHVLGRVLSSILLPLLMLGWYLFALGRLDEAVNKRLHPELVGKGIYKNLE